MNTALKCIKCEKEFVTEETVSVGGLPKCIDCGGDLTIPGLLEIGCCNCDFRQKVTGININECSACPECGWALDVLSQDLDSEDTEGVDDTVRKESDGLDSDDTLEMPSPEIKPGSEQHVNMSNPAITGTGETIALSDPPSEDEDEYPEENYAPTGTVIKEGHESPELKSISKTETQTGIKSKKFGKYEILGEIARGGMGIVYRVMDSDLKRELALKVLIAGEDASEELLKRFLREARAAAHLNHPHVVPIHEVGNVDGQYYFTMDLIEGTSFDKIIESKWMPVDEIVTHIRNIAMALKVAHDNNIIHRDIKPANIMFDVKTERALLTDFGLAKELDSNTMLSMTGMMMGSPAYMSPEQARGMIHDIDNRSDIYSLGVVLYQAVTGEQPFSSSTLIETVKKVVYEDPEAPRKIAPDKVSVSLQNIILKCMEKESENRYQEMQELINDLNAYLEGRKVLAKAPPKMTMYWRKIRRKPVLLSFIIGFPFATALLLFMAWYLFIATKPLDLAEEAIKSNDPKRQSGAISDIKAWLKSGRFSELGETTKILNLLTFCLKNKNEEVTLQACLALKDIGDPRAIEPLVTLLKKDSMPENISTAAISALSTLASNKKADKEIINKAFKKIAMDKSLPEKLRQAAIRGAVKAWGKGTMDAMMKISQDESENEEVRITAIESIATKVNMGSPSMYKMIKLSSNNNPRIKQAAMNALNESRDHLSILDLYGIKEKASGINKKLSGILQKNAQHQQNIMNMINEMDNKVENKKTPSQIISEKLKGKSPKTRLTAAYDLGEIGDGKDIPILVSTLLSDKDPDVVCVAAESIIKLSNKTKEKPDLKKIIPLLDNDDPIKREQAVYLIGNTGNSNAFDHVIARIAKEENMIVISMIARNLKRVDGSKALPLLENLLEKTIDKNYSTAVTCIKSMQAFGKPAAKHLIPYVKSTNSNIKNAAIKALSELSARNYGDDVEKWKKWAE